MDDNLKDIKIITIHRKSGDKITYQNIKDISIKDKVLLIYLDNMNKYEHAIVIVPFDKIDLVETNFRI